MSALQDIFFHYQLTAQYPRKQTNSKTSDLPKGQSEKCWCTIFSIQGSTRLKFTTFENLLLLVFVIFQIPTKNTSLPRRLSVKLGFSLCVYIGRRWLFDLFVCRESGRILFYSSFLSMRVVWDVCV